MSADQRRAERILVVRLSAMGDVIHTLPAVAALRCAFPAAKIDWLIEERWAELLCSPATSRRGPRNEQRPLVDGIHTVRLADWGKSLFTPFTLQKIATVWNDVRAANYDIALDLQGAIRSAVLAGLSGAREVFGAAEPWESPASLLYTRKVVTRGAHVIQQNFSIVEALAGRKLDLPDAVLPREPAAEKSIGEMLAQKRIGEFALINPGAGWGAKLWPAERYGQVTAHLARAGLSVIVNYGPGEEALADEVVSASGGVGLRLQGSISELIALMRRARLFLGGDTGPMHLASALRVPVVAIFGPTDPERNGPYGTRSIVLRSPSSLTTHTRRAQPDAGLLEIRVEAVLAAAQQLLKDSRHE